MRSGAVSHSAACDYPKPRGCGCNKQLHKKSKVLYLGKNMFLEIIEEI